MLKMESRMLFSLILIIPHVLCQVPIPHTPLGFVFSGKSSAPIHLVAFLDLTCPDCLQCWPIVKQVAQIYGPEVVHFKVQLFPLPYHTNAFIAAQSVQVASAYNTSTVFPWIDVIFKHQNAFYNFNTMNKNGYDILNMVASLAPFAGIPQETMKTGLTNTESDGAARIAWKHGCQRTVAGTPTFLINDILVSEALSTWKVEDWEKLINSLLKS